jgi:transposase-like protein
MKPTTLRRQRPVASHKSELVNQLPEACANERAAVEFMEAQRWGDTPRCARCSKTDVVQVKAKDGSRNSRFLWRCRSCKRQYTVRVGTVMEDSPIPLRHWCYAFWAACSSKKGVSAMQIQRQTGLSYKSALFMMHRIRWAMKPINDEGKSLNGIVEMDTTFLGGKQKGVGHGNVDNKPKVLGMVERGGNLRLRHMTSLKSPALKPVIMQHIARTARLMTDEAPMFKRVGATFLGGHDTVNHSQYEFARGDVTTNTIEGVFALLKRGMKGTFHSVSKEHLHRYLNEFESAGTRGSWTMASARCSRSVARTRSASPTRIRWRTGETSVLRGLASAHKVWCGPYRRGSAGVGESRSSALAHRVSRVSRVRH